MQDFASSGFVNVVGGCCGTTPSHIKHIADHLRNIPPRVVPNQFKDLVLSGLEPLFFTKELGFVNIGERCNVTGSRRFANLIKKGNFEEALSVALDQVCFFPEFFVGVFFRWFERAMIIK